MMKQTVTTLLMSFYSIHAFSAEAPWIFTSTVPAKNEMISISRKEFCRPLNTTLMNTKCAQYKQGYVCPQDDESQFVITTYTNKNECNKALKKARRLLAKK